MPTQSGPTRAVFETVLTPEYLQITRVLHVALASGPTLFAAVLLSYFLFTAHPPGAAPAAVQTMDGLSVAHVGFTIAAYLLAPLLFRRVLTGTRLDPGGDSTTPEELARQALLLLRTAVIVRLAVLEGAALFGIAVCVLGVSGGILYANPIHWLNLGSTLLLILFGLLTFPTREGLLDILESSFGT